MILPLGEPHLAKQLECALPGAADRRQLRLDVLERGQRRDQVELLEHEAERPEPERRELVVGELGQITTLEEDTAGARAVERSQQLQERRLAGAARALERDELAGSDIEIDPVQ